MLKADDKVTLERKMKVTTLDLPQSRFKTVMRAFDRAEVTTLLEAADDDYEHALRENERLRHELLKLEAALNQYRELERASRAR